MSVEVTKMTARQFLELGEDPPGVRLELVDGEIKVSPSPEPSHGFSEYRLARILGNHIEQHDLGAIFPDIDTIFGEHDVRRPDLIYFSKARLHLVGKKAMEGPPDLCVEIISPSTSTVDRRQKFQQYSGGGVAYYWIVDPAARSIEAFKLENGSYRSFARGERDQVVRLEPFADLDIPLAELWWPR